MLSAQDMKDRRTLKRIAVPGISLKYRVGRGISRFKGSSDALNVVNLSKSGIAFELQENIAYNTPVELRMKFPDGKKLELKGRVRWNKNEDSAATLVGVQFNPFGEHNKYNPLHALEYLRSMKDQAIELKPEQPPGSESN